jgi:hypothetical protein
MKRKVKAGITSLSLPVFIQSTASTTGAGLGGLTHTTSGLVAEYRRQGQSTWTQLGVGTGLVSKTLGTYTSGGFVADGSLDGAYEFDPPDAAFATGARFVVIRLRGAANMLPVLIEIELDTVDYQTDAFGALKPTTAGRTLDVSAGGEAGIDLANVGSPSTTLNLSGTTIKTATDVEAKIDAMDDYIDTEVAAIKAKTDNLPSDPADASDIAASFVTVNNTLATIAGYIDTEVAAIKAKTDNLPVDPADASDIAASFVTVNNTLSAISGYIDTEVASIKAKTDNLPALPAAVGDIPTANHNRDAVLNALPSAGYVNGSFGDRILISDNDNRTVKVTGGGSGHIGADVHEIQPGVITNLAFAPGAIDSNALASSAAIEVANAVAALSVLVDLVTMITGSGTPNAKWTASALSLAPTGGGGGGTGTGARTVTITVLLAGAPVEGARVRFTKAAETYVGSTNVSGQITFNVDDGSWVVGIGSPNATFGGAVLVVSANQTQTYTLTAISITPSGPGGVTGYWLCLGVNGLPESGVTMSMQATAVPHGSTGLAIDTGTRTTTSNGAGVAQFTDLTPGVRYACQRGTGQVVYVTIPEDAIGTLELNSLLGAP